MHSMKLAIVAVITVSVIAAGMFLLNNQAMQANAQGNATASQSGALLGYGGQIFGLADVSTNDHLTKINIASDFLLLLARSLRFGWWTEIMLLPDIH